MRTLAQQIADETAADGLTSQPTADGAVVLIRHRFAASAGETGQPGQLRLALCTGEGGRLERRTLLGHLDAHWQRGQFSLSLPGDTGSYRSDAVEVLGLAMDVPAVLADAGDSGCIEALATRLHRDPVVTSVLQALWVTSEADLLDDVLLKAGARTVLSRLAQLAGGRDAARLPGRKLSRAQVQRLMDITDGGRARPSVDAMASAVGLPAGPFARAMRETFGQSPYQFLLQRRMEWARARLLAGERVTEVAMAAGYLNASKFSAAFQRVIGCAPSALR